MSSPAALGSDPLGNLTNLYNRPITKRVSRIPGSDDVQPPGTVYAYGDTFPLVLYISLGAGNWDIIAGAGQGIVTLDGDTGSATGDTVTIEGGNNITTDASGDTLTVSVSGTTQYALQVGSAAGALSSLALGTSGQVLTSAGAGSNPVWAASPGAFTWQDQAISASAVSKNGYFCTAALTLTLPASPSDGDVVMVATTTASNVAIQGSGSQTITIGSGASSAGGTATSAAVGNSIALYYRSTNTSWYAVPAPQGIWTLA